MKLSKESLERLRCAIRAEDTIERRARYRAGMFPNAKGCRDKDKRYRWDLFWHVGGMLLLDQEEAQALLDSHIDTALRHCVPSLTGGNHA